MTISFSENEDLKALLSGRVMNYRTTSHILSEVVKETVGPGSIALEHLQQGQSSWPKLQPGTLQDKRKKSNQIFVRTGRVKGALSRYHGNGELNDFGSSADIYSQARWGRKRYTFNGMYAQIGVMRSDATLTIGFNGVYKHSAGFNRARRALAREISGQKKLTAYDVRRHASVGATERRLKAMNADRRARGLRTIKKFEAKGSKGYVGSRMVLARGKDNLAYADIVQRGKFKGIRHESGTLFNPKGIAARRRHGSATSGQTVRGTARPLLPYTQRDERRIQKAITRAVDKIVFNINRGNTAYM